MFNTIKIEEHVPFEVVYVAADAVFEDGHWEIVTSGEENSLSLQSEVALPKSKVADFEREVFKNLVRYRIAERTFVTRNLLIGRALYETCIHVQ